MCHALQGVVEHRGEVTLVADPDASANRHAYTVNASTCQAASKWEVRNFWNEPMTSATPVMRLNGVSQSHQPPA